MIKLYYFNGQNFGDALTGALIAKLTGEKVVCESPYFAELSATGSILSTDYLFMSKPKLLSWEMLKLAKRKFEDFRNPELKIWGTGFLQIRDVPNPILIRRINVCAVRGKLTRHVLDKYGAVETQQRVEYGDPGLFYPQLLDRMPEKKYELGVVAHECDYLAGEFICEQMAKSGCKTKFIYARREHPIEIVEDIASCSRIISSSLHGCIVADSLNIPNKMMLLSYFGRPKEMHLFKYRDYYSAYGMELPQPLEIRDFTIGAAWIANRLKMLAAIPKELIDEMKGRLLSVFPYPIKVDGAKV